MKFFHSSHYIEYLFRIFAEKFPIVLYIYIYIYIYIYTLGLPKIAIVPKPDSSRCFEP